MQGFTRRKLLAAGPAMVAASGLPIWAVPRSWVETAYPSVAYYNAVDKGGHFAAWEEPELFSAEVRAAFISLR